MLLFHIVFMYIDGSLGRGLNMTLLFQFPLYFYSRIDRNDKAFIYGQWVIIFHEFKHDFHIRAQNEFHNEGRIVLNCQHTMTH